MDLQLTGKIAVVTGGTRGIGIAIVRRLLSEGYAVVTCGRTPPEEPIASEGRTPRNKLQCTISPEGQALHDRIIPLARRSQASLLRVLSPQERRVVYQALHRLHQHCLMLGGVKEGD